MQTNIKEIRIKVKISNDINYPDVKARAFLSFVDEHVRTMTFSGFTVRKSKYEGYYVTPPSNKLFKFFRSEKSWWREIEREIIRDYEDAMIPIIEE